jgi:hypothetical protein
MTYTNDDVAIIRRMKEAGERWSSIALAVNKSESALRAWWSRNALSFDLPPKPRSKSRLTDGRVGLAIKKICRENPYLPYRDYQARLREVLGPDEPIPSNTTIFNYLEDNGFKSVSLTRRPLLSAKNQQLRLDFARHWISKTDVLKRLTIWSDETTVRKLPGRLKLLYRVHQSVPRENLPANYQTQQGGFSVMFWGFFSYYGLGPIVALDGNQNHVSYMETIRNHLLPYLARIKAEHGVDLQFMQDNASCHRAKPVMNLFATEAVTVLKWPAQSPDMNPIENLWAIMKRRRQKKYGIPASKSVLIEQIVDTWQSFPLDLVRTLCESMDSRLEQCIKRKGKGIDY